MRDWVMHPGDGSDGTTGMCGLEHFGAQTVGVDRPDRNRPCKHVERARIVLASADRHSAQRVAQSVGVSQPTVWRWQRRFAEMGECVLRDTTCRPARRRSPPTARVMALTCTD
jgi:hypothetical protein